MTNAHPGKFDQTEVTRNREEDMKEFTQRESEGNAPKAQPDAFSQNVGDLARKIVKPLKEHEDRPGA